MAETAGMGALLALEDSAPDALHESIPRSRAMFWPLARWPLSRAIAEADIGTSVPSYAKPPLRQRAIRTARRAIPNPRSTSRAPRAEHLFIVSGWTKTQTASGFSNWLSDDFAAALGDRAIVVQDAYLDALSRGPQRPVLPRTYSFARALERIARATAAHPMAQSDRRRLEHTMDELFRAVDFPVGEAARSRAIADAVGRAERAPHAEREFGRILDRIRPKRIYMQTAAYGDRSPQIRAAHERGIGVAELQHGWIGSSHAAYNFGAAMGRAPLVDHLPDTLLTFGEFWGRGIRFPGRIVPIGKPSLDALRADSAGYADRPLRVLFVSSNFAYEQVEDAVLWMRAALPESWTISIRPHPVERATLAASLPRLAGLPGIEFDGIGDASASLLASRAVVGFASTMLYEALAYGCHVAVVESVLAEHYADSGVFPLRISDDESARAATRAFQSPPQPAERAVGDSVWLRDAVANFRAEVGR